MKLFLLLITLAIAPPVTSSKSELEARQLRRIALCFVEHNILKTVDTNQRFWRIRRFLLPNMSCIYRFKILLGTKANVDFLLIRYVLVAPILPFVLYI